MNFRKRLPSLTGLLVLEAAIRHRSFTEAAKELGVTQAAVSRQIAELEQEFGTQLFKRGHRRIEPTQACLTLGGILADSFSDIADGVSSIRAVVPETVRIGATIAFSSFWLLPRLAEFRRLHPSIPIRVVSQDSPYDLASGEVDIAVRYGVPPFADGAVIASLGDTIFPVCSPSYAASHDVSAFPDGGFDLIDTEAANRSWYRWADWFARQGRRSPAIQPAFCFSHYTDTIYAARAGQGVALGWGALIDGFIADGSLVKLGTCELAGEGGYNIVVPWKTRRADLCQPVIEWLTQSFRL